MRACTTTGAGRMKTDRKQLGELGLGNPQIRVYFGTCFPLRSKSSLQIHQWADQVPSHLSPLRPFQIRQWAFAGLPTYPLVGLNGYTTQCISPVPTDSESGRTAPIQTASQLFQVPPKKCSTFSFGDSASKPPKQAQVFGSVPGWVPEGL